MFELFMKYILVKINILIIYVIGFFFLDLIYRLISGVEMLFRLVFVGLV